MHPNQSSDIPPPWRVVVFTTIPNDIVYTATEAILRELGHRVVGVVTTPGPVSRRSSGYLSVVEAVRPGVDVLVSTHPALLPRHRGPWPLQWMFRNGDAEAGITVHRIAPEFDTGPILAQATVPVTDEDDITTVMGKLIPQADQLLGVAFARIANGDAGEPQDETRATYAGIFEDDWREVDWTQPARTIHNHVRSWAGVSDGPQGALADIDGRRVVMTKTRLLGPTEDPGAVATPGTVVEPGKGELAVRCGDGASAVLAWGPAAEA